MNAEQRAKLRRLAEIWKDQGQGVAPLTPAELLDLLDEIERLEGLLTDVAPTLPGAVFTFLPVEPRPVQASRFIGEEPSAPATSP